MKYITLNNDYVLKPDDGLTLIMASLVGRNRLKGIEDSFTCVIHPIYAIILSFIDGREYDECVNDAAETLEVTKDLIDGFIQKILDNPEKVYLKSGDKISTFPPHTIVTIPYRNQIRRYSPDIFSYTKVDIRMKRHLTPSSITFMVNNTCVTNCIYCYQDKRQISKCTIPLERIFEIIHEARRLNVNTFDVIGGEFFLYEHWRDVLQELRRYGYNPYMSTKIPLQEDDIKFLSQIGICDLQVSIDSFIESHLIQSLSVSSGYVDKMIKSLKLLEQYNIPIMIHSVLTKYNASIADMKSIYDRIKNLKNLLDWHIVKGEPSLYPKEDYSNIKISSTDLNNIADYLNQLSNESAIKIQIPGKEHISDLAKKAVSLDAELHQFFQRAFCSGLFSSLYILPDGKVTICEQLYWNRDFIVGDVNKNSLMEIWNSDKAKSIFFIKKEDIPSDSLCHSCEVFESCRSVRQVCYREIIRKYGKDKWYYPDTNCPYAKQ